jgi:hypothetical protein
MIKSGLDHFDGWHFVILLPSLALALTLSSGLKIGFLLKVYIFYDLQLYEFGTQEYSQNQHPQVVVPKDDRFLPRQQTEV